MSFLDLINGITTEKARKIKGTTDVVLIHHCNVLSTTTHMWKNPSIWNIKKMTMRAIMLIIFHMVSYLFIRYSYDAK